MMSQASDLIMITSLIHHRQADGPVLGRRRHRYIGLYLLLALTLWDRSDSAATPDEDGLVVEAGTTVGHRPALSVDEWLETQGAREGAPVVA
jgi:hypothetical protein